MFNRRELYSTFSYRSNQSESCIVPIVLRKVLSAQGHSIFDTAGSFPHECGLISAPHHLRQQITGHLKGMVLLIHGLL